MENAAIEDAAKLIAAQHREKSHFIHEAMSASCWQIDHTAEHGRGIQWLLGVAGFDSELADMPAVGNFPQWQRLVVFSYKDSPQHRRDQ